MRHRYPSPHEAGVKIPAYLIEDRFRAGFGHGLRGGQLDHVEYFRRSFRLGFRAAKLYLREVRRSRGVLHFPGPYRLRLRSHWQDTATHERVANGMGR